MLVTSIIITIFIDVHSTGIPSTPQISVSSNTGLMVRLLITTAYTGVPAGDNSLHINISVYNTTIGLLYQTRLDSSLINFLGTSASLSHELSLQAGSYQFSATAGNRYGRSPESELTAGAVGEGEELLHAGYWFTDTIIQCSINSSHYCWSECQCGDCDTSSEFASHCDHLLLYQ